MIVFVEGLSSTGKTYLLDRLIEKNPDWIRFKGAGQVVIGMYNRWQYYNFYMHNIIERLDQMNDYKKVILWDRGLSDVVYNEDETYRKELLRVIKSHVKKCLIYIKISEKEWPIFIEIKNTKEGSNYLDHIKRYNEVIQSFSSYIIEIKKPDFNIKEIDIESVIKFINNKL